MIQKGVSVREKGIQNWSHGSGNQVRQSQQIESGATPTASSGEDVSPAMKAKVAPARDALQAALREIKTPEQAQRVVDELLAAAAGKREVEVSEQVEETEQPEQAIRQAAAPVSDETAATILEAARQIAGTSGELREALEQVTQEATNPEQEGIEDETIQRPMDLLRTEILNRMQPLQAVDARLFLAINHMPHTRVSNRIMHGVTTVMNGGFGWVLGLLLATAVDRKQALSALHQVLPPLWFATMAVEFPIKRFFKRQRPFIDVVQAISVGRKPGNYSFPSGHSAAAFAGAWLIARHYPQLRPLLYALASLVGFTRIYLGAHYPGDVVSGALTGMVIAESTRWFIARADELDDGRMNVGEQVTPD